MRKNERRPANYVITVGPAGDQPMTVLFEPGAGLFELEPGSAFRIEVSGPDTEGLELSHGDGYVSVWPSPALWVRVTDDSGAVVPLLGYK